MSATAFALPEDMPPRMLLEAIRTDLAAVGLGALCACLTKPPEQITDLDLFLLEDVVRNAQAVVLTLARELSQAEALKARGRAIDLEVITKNVAGARAVLRKRRAS